MAGTRTHEMALDNILGAIQTLQFNYDNATQQQATPDCSRGLPISGSRVTAIQFKTSTVVENDY